MLKSSGVAGAQLLQVHRGHVGREQADELHRVAAQVSAAPVCEARGLRGEQMLAVERLEALVLAGAEGALTR